MAIGASAKKFYGWRVVHAAFVLGTIGWGTGFFGPSVFLAVTLDVHSWSLGLISAAISLHFLVGAYAGANLPALHRRVGAANVTKAGAAAMAVGIVGWSAATAPWQLFLATALTGIGWGTMSAAALNLFVAPWFVRARPAALSMAYNGGSVGGIVFTPLWVTAIGALGFPLAALLVGAIVLLMVWTLADRVLARTPQSMRLLPDGDATPGQVMQMSSEAGRALPGAALWHDRSFRTLAAGMALGLFAQIGLTAHLYALLVPVLGAQGAGAAMMLITLMAIAGRTLPGRLLALRADRSLIACACYIAQLAGSIAFIVASGTNVAWLLAGIVLFGIGFGNATSLPPLIAQVEFADEDVARATALIIGIAQTGYAFAPAFFGLVPELASSRGTSSAAPAIFAAAAVAQALAACAFLRLSLRARRIAH